MCALCDSRRDCLITALLHNEPYGVWGGYTRVERAAAMRRLRGNVQAAIRAYDDGIFDPWEKP